MNPEEIKKLEQIEKTKIGKVIKIISDEKLITNFGSDIVKLNDEIQIFSISGQKITDPETDEFLGYFYNIKDRLIVVRVEKKYSIAETRTISIPTYNGLTAMAGILKSSLTDFTTYEYKQSKLNVDEKDIEYLVTDEDNKIKIGDLVRVV